MTTITDFIALGLDGRIVPADAFGNNVAFSCIDCSAPVLAVVRPHHRGHSASNPSVCRSCGSKFWVEAQIAERRLLVHKAA